MKIEVVGKNINATKAKVDKCVYGSKLPKKAGESEESEGSSEGSDDDSDEEVDWSFPALLQQEQTKDDEHRRRRRYHEPKRIAKTRKELAYEYQELKIFWDTFGYIRKTAEYVKQLMDSNRLPKVAHDLTDFEIPEGLADPDSGGGGGLMPDFEDPDEEEGDDDEDSEESSEGSDSKTSSEPGSASSTKPGATATAPKVHHEHRRRRRTVADYKTLKTDVGNIDEQLVDIGHQMEEIQGVAEEAADKVANYCEAKEKLAKESLQETQLAKGKARSGKAR